MKRIVALFLSVCLLVPLASCKGTSKSKIKKYSTTEILMTTVVTITVYAESDDILDGAFDICKSYEKLLSRTVSGSDIDRINKSEGKAVTVDSDTAELLKTALDICNKSNGAFDITVSPLTELWNITEATAPPEDGKITEALKTVDYNNVTSDGDKVTAKQNAQIDLGGIAKGYIADKVKEYLKEQGVVRGLINLGGNVVLLGDNDGKPYNVGIQKPFADTGETELTVKLSDMTAVTSGIYERYFEFNGKIYHHIIDPKSGYPVDNDVASVTIICNNSCIADGLSTACLVLGVEEGKKLAEDYGAETVFILRDGTVIISDGLVLSDGDEPCISLK